MKFDLSLPLAAVQAAEGDEPAATEGKRTISGIALPWEVAATVSTGQTVTFARGSVDLADTPVVLHHQPDRPIGIVASQSDTDTALVAEARVSRTRDGDEALVLAHDGVLRGFSVGVNPTEWEEREDGSLYVTAAAADHLAIVVSPAFTEARVTEVAAAAAQPKESEVDTATTVQEGAAPAVVAAAPRTPAAASLRLPNLGEYLLASVQRDQAPERWAAVEAAVQAAAPHTLYPDVAKGQGVSVVGPWIDLAAPAARPVSEAFGVRQAPSGVKSFIRPKVKDHLDAAATAAEKSDVTDGPLTTDEQTVTMSFIKRAANISAEALAFTSSDVLGLVGRDLVRAYLLGFDAVVTAALGTGATGTEVALDADTAEAKLYEAAAAIYGVTYTMPDLFIMAPDVWAALGGFKATDGRALFPYLGPSNASGTSDGVTSFGFNVLGLRPVVTHGLAAGKAYLCASDYFEVYESSRVDMQVDEPTILGRALGIGGAVGTNVVEGKALVPVTITATP